MEHTLHFRQPRGDSGHGSSSDVSVAIRLSPSLLLHSSLLLLFFISSPHLLPPLFHVRFASVISIPDQYVPEKEKEREKERR